MHINKMKKAGYLKIKKKMKIFKIINLGLKKHLNNKRKKK